MRSARETQFLARGFERAGIGRQRARHEFIVIVHARREAMHGADEGALAAAHHAEPDARRRRSCLRSPCVSLSIAMTAASLHRNTASARRDGVLISPACALILPLSADPRRNRRRLSR